MRDYNTTAVNKEVDSGAAVVVMLIISPFPITTSQGSHEATHNEEMLCIASQ